MNGPATLARTPSAPSAGLGALGRRPEDRAERHAAAPLVPHRPHARASKRLIAGSKRPGSGRRLVTKNASRGKSKK